jgi:thiamine transporter ThiT
MFKFQDLVAHVFWIYPRTSSALTAVSLALLTIDIGMKHALTTLVTGMLPFVTESARLVAVIGSPAKWRDPCSWRVRLFEEDT